MTPGSDDKHPEEAGSWINVSASNTTGNASATWIGDPIPNMWQPAPLYPMPAPNWSPGYTTPNFQITRQAHTTSDPTVVNHCPFCGSGALVGRSDGGVDCNICNETFRVSKQPMYSNMPSTEEGAGIESMENDPLTAEDPFEAPDEAGMLPGEEEVPPTEEEESDEEPLPDFMSAKNGTPLDDDDFILHHAIRSVRGS